MSNMSLSNPDYLAFRQRLRGQTNLDMFAFADWILTHRAELKERFRASEDYADYLAQMRNGNIDVEHVERVWTRAQFLSWCQFQMEEARARDRIKWVPLGVYPDGLTIQQLFVLKPPGKKEPPRAG